MNIDEFFDVWTELVKPITLGRYKKSVVYRGMQYSVRYSRRSADSPMGRFGGGWNWNVGVKVGGSTLMFSLLVAELSFSRRKL